MFLEELENFCKESSYRALHLERLDLGRKSFRSEVANKLLAMLFLGGKTQMKIGKKDIIYVQQAWVRSLNEDT